MLAEVLLNYMVWLSVTSYKWESYLEMIRNLEEVAKNSRWMPLKAARTWAEMGSPPVETDLFQFSWVGPPCLAGQVFEGKKVPTACHYFDSFPNGKALEHSWPCSSALQKVNSSPCPL